MMVLSKAWFPVAFFFFSIAAAFDFAGSPFFAPLLDNICKSVNCGKGTCRPSTNNTLIPFSCECETGWKKFTNDTGMEFLPCVIPNCTMDVSCTQPSSPSPAPPLSLPNSSIFDPCTFAHCGEGTCVKTSAFGQRCECKEGYFNIANITSFPCVGKCYLEAQCTGFRIGGKNQSSPEVSPPVSSGKNRAYLGLSRSTHWIIILAILGIVALTIS